jgi:hypothetical protein
MVAEYFMDLTLSEEERLDALRVLHAARELLPGRWCQGHDARCADGHETTAGSNDAARFCVIGALRRSSRELRANVLPALDLLHFALCYKYPWNSDARARVSNEKADLLREWNDGTAQNLEEVLELFDHALILLR